MDWRELIQDPLVEKMSITLLSLVSNQKVAPAYFSWCHNSMTNWGYFMLQPNLICASLSSTSVLLSSGLEMFSDNVWSVFIWCHSSHIGVTKQWHDSHVGIPNQSCESCTLFFLLNTFFCYNKFAWLLATWGKRCILGGGEKRSKSLQLSVNNYKPAVAQ